MSQLPRTWEPKKGAGDRVPKRDSGDKDPKKGSVDKSELQKAFKNKKDETVSKHKEEEKDKESCCKQIGLAKMTPEQLNAWKAGLLAAQPKLTAKEIRRYRLKYCVVICLELEEEGLPESAAYIRYLLHMNVEMRLAAGQDSLLWQKPKLRDNVEYLDRLREGLTEAERAHQASRPGEQCSALLDMAVYFMLKDEAWWWVAEQLFLWVVSVVERFKADGGRREAITRYIYGMFLLKQLEDVETARLQLQMARALSAGKDWDAAKELNREQDTVFREVCGLLFKALVRAAQQCREEEPAEAIRLCSSALRRARDSQNPEHVADALYELGISYQVAHEDVKSVEKLTQYLQMCRDLHNPQGICNAHLELAICFKNLSDTDGTFKHLESFLHVAETNFLTERRAEANRYLGEFHLNMGNYIVANTHFSTSFSLYYKLAMMEETEQVRGLQGIAAGHQLLPLFAKVLVRAPDSSRHMLSLLRWKEVHRPFWERSECSLILEDSEETERSSSNEEVAGGAEEKPAEEKPAEEKPGEEKPAEEKPAEEKPAEEKPGDEKPAEVAAGAVAGNVAGGDDVSEYSQFSTAP